MSTMNVKEKRNRSIGGVFLIILGVLLLLAQFMDFGANLGALIPGGLGVIFMLWGILTREDGLMIPGGILMGVGAGVYAVTSPLPEWMGLADANEGALFMLFFALGWITITLFSAIFGKETHWWALIPAAVFLLIAAGIGLGGIFMTVLELLGNFWPAILILIGLGILLNQLRGGDEPEEKLKAG